MNRRIENEQLKRWLHILGCAATKQAWQPDEQFQNLEEWQVLFQVAKENSVASMLYATVSTYIKEQNLEIPVFEEWKQYTKMSVTYEVVKYIQIRQILKEAKQRGLLLVFFKGAVIADLYPNYLERISSDTDIWVEESQYEQAEQIFFDLGYCKNREESKPQVGVYFHPDMHHVIELHTRLWEDYSGRKIDILNGMELTKRESLLEMTVCGIELTTLGITEHLIFQMFHIVKHFSLQGVGARYLVDISLFVRAYQDKIDWKRFWHSMEQLGYVTFCHYFFKIAIEYIGMPKECIEQVKGVIKQKIDDDILWEFAEDLFKVGRLAEGDAANWQIFGAMTPYFTGEYQAPKQDWKKRLLILFPSRKSLPNNYGYAKKLPFLLPIAWVHRVMLFLIHRVTSKEETYNASEKMQVTQYRLHMMEDMGLMED